MGKKASPIKHCGWTNAECHADARVGTRLKPGSKGQDMKTEQIQWCIPTRAHLDLSLTCLVSDGAGLGAEFNRICKIPRIGAAISALN